MDPASRENIFDELNNFEKKKPTEIPSILEDYLILIGKSGDIIFSWAKLKPLFKYKLDRVIKQFNEDYPAKNLPFSPNVDKFNYDDMRAKLLNAVEEFSGAPFTIQRLCELVMCPNKHYKRVDKFMRALEKDLLVVSTIEPLCKRQRTNSETSSLVNGVTETVSSLNGMAQSPQSSVDPNEEANVESTDASEPYDQVQDEKEFSADTNQGENIDLESEAEANEDESLREDSGFCTLNEDMETAVSSSSTPESNKLFTSENLHTGSVGADSETNKEADETSATQLPNQTSERDMEALPLEQTAEAEADSNKLTDEPTAVEIQPSSDVNDNEIVSDSSDLHQVSTCTEEQHLEKNAEVKGEMSADDGAEVSKGNVSPESSDEPVPDSVSQSDATIPELVTTGEVVSSPPDSAGEPVVQTSSIPESSNLLDEPCAPESTTTNAVLGLDLGDVLQAEPEPMEED